MKKYTQHPATNMSQQDYKAMQNYVPTEAQFQQHVLDMVNSYPGATNIPAEHFKPVLVGSRFSLSWLTRNTYLTSCPFTAALVVFSGTMALFSVVMLLANLFINL